MKLSPGIGLIFVALFFCLTVVEAQTSTEIETRIVAKMTALENLADENGADVYEKLQLENNSLRRDIIRFGQRTNILKYDFPILSKKMFIVTSNDGKFRVYSWHDQQGGSGRIFQTVFQFRDSKGKVHAWAPESGGEGEVCSGFYHQIFQTDTAGGTIYLANSTAQCSSSLSLQDISIFRIDGSKLNTKLKVIKTSKGLTDSIRFQYNFFSVVDHPERPVKLFFWDDAKNSFRFPVVIEDKDMPDGRVTEKFITYRFNGKYFIKVS